ncbi:hypothetical protein TEA_016541 [Camellia sinensis var. sinensis]|uniref:Uncharacterized protein n=1 Tax=Camellia sinensis var. sinensis TaxID=542762 RepID=A0A4S4CWV6_CAMSN|nr:hypothetical protein TEA_016541 [Camellia sinensis var. sinensis]
MPTWNNMANVAGIVDVGNFFRLHGHGHHRGKSHGSFHELPDQPLVIQSSRWANLPLELLCDVIKRLEESESNWPARKHVVAYAAVCRSWRSMCKEIVRSPEFCGKLTFPVSLKQTQTLEQEAYPALDELTSKISTLNLERVRQIKSRLVAISGRVQKVRDELEHLLDDDNDMAEMYLTEKFAGHSMDHTSLKEELYDEALEDDEDRHIQFVVGFGAMCSVERRLDAVYPNIASIGVVVIEYLKADSSHVFWEIGESKCMLICLYKHDGESVRHLLFVVRWCGNYGLSFFSCGGEETKSQHSYGTYTGIKPNIEELEMLLEAYFAQIDGISQKLFHISEYANDTEDFINIMLDEKQNQLLQMGVMLSTANMIMNAGIAVVGLFGMNIEISLFSSPTINFWETAIGTVGGCVALYLIAVGKSQNPYLGSDGALPKRLLSLLRVTNSIILVPVQRIFTLCRLFIESLVSALNKRLGLNLDIWYVLGCYTLSHNKDHSTYYLHVRSTDCHLVTGLPNSEKHNDDFLQVGGNWEFPAGTEFQFERMPQKDGYPSLNLVLYLPNRENIEAIEAVLKYKKRFAPELLDYQATYRTTILKKAKLAAFFLDSDTTTDTLPAPLVTNRRRDRSLFVEKTPSHAPSFTGGGSMSKRGALVDLEAEAFSSSDVLEAPLVKDEPKSLTDIKLEIGASGPSTVATEPTTSIVERAKKRRRETGKAIV